MRIFALVLVCMVVGCSGGEKTSDADRDDVNEDVDRDPTTDDTGSTEANPDDTSTSDGDGDDTGSTDPVDTGEPLVDNDGDGFTSDVDCNDDNFRIFPGAAEVCNLKDDDCDGVVDDDPIDGTPAYLDMDGDGYGDPDTLTRVCRLEGVHSEDGTDCDDTESLAYPGAIEVCDEVDNDCDGFVDDGATDMTEWFVDADSDGYGDPSTGLTACFAPDGYVADGTDCNDAASEARPGGTEFCDELDNDCNGLVDDTTFGLSTYYLDEDGDGHGAGEGEIEACSAPEGYAGGTSDCDDGDAARYPGADEICDTIDNDCDGLVDADDPDHEGVGTWYRDVDGDGWGDPATAMTSCLTPSGYISIDGDCDDLDADVSPDAIEIECNGIDDDCDGTSSCATVCGNDVVEEGEEYDPPPGPYTYIDVDDETCRWDFSSVRQLYCNGGCSWAGPAGCDEEDADIFCKLKTDNPLSTAISWTDGISLGEHGFPCSWDAFGTVVDTDRGIDVTVKYQDESILATHGGGATIQDPVCTDP